MTNPTVHILVGVHNGLDYTKNLLKCLQKQSYTNFRTLIVDDGSTDGTSQYLEEHHPDVSVLKGDGNLWWTGSLHAGIEQILAGSNAGDLVLTINNDCTFKNDYIKTLVRLSQQLGRPIVGSLALDASNIKKIWDGGVSINWKRASFHAKPHKVVDDLPNGATFDDTIDTLTTKGTIYPSEVFTKIGNFNRDSLPHYLSDYEFACRAKKSGYRLVLSYEAIVYNDTVRTGLGDNLPKVLSYRQFWQLLFSRKSRLNIVDHYQFIRLCAPKKYKLLNYGFLVLKFFYLLSFTVPFVVFRPIVVRFRQLIMD